MPVTRERQQSPQDRRSASPPGPFQPPFAGPSKIRMTTNDVQKRQLEKLFANPEREPIPKLGHVEPKLRPAQDIIKNVQASSAAAGSGEFHVYKHSRRREFERIKQMERKTRDLEEQTAFRARQDTRDAEAEAKTAKNRAKRQRRKGGPKVDIPEDAGSRKRKLEGGAAVRLKEPDAEGQEEEEEEKEEKEEKEEEEAEARNEAAIGQHMRMESKITIHDED